MYIIQLAGMLIFEGNTEEEVLEDVRRLLSYLPQNNEEKPPDWNG